MMKNVYKVIVLGLHHDHVWTHLQELHRTQSAALIGVADPSLPLLSQAREKYSCPTYADYEELLDRSEADIAYIFANNRHGAELAVSAAERGLHVMVEKPIAADLTGADSVYHAAREHGVRLMVNWPIAWSPSISHALALAADGEIGRVWQVKYRAAHAGPRELGCSKDFCDWLFDAHLNGGGALIDYASYGCAIARTLLGMPASVHAISGNFVKQELPVEDNAVILLDYKNASAIAEASWTQQGNLSSYIVTIYGEKGTLVADANGEGQLLLATPHDPGGRLIKLDPIGTHFRHATAHFTWALRHDLPFFRLVSAEVGRDTQAILSAAQTACLQPGTSVLEYRQ